MKVDTRNPIALAMMGMGILLMAATLVFAILSKPPDPKTAVAPQMRDIAKYKHESQHAQEVKQLNLAGTRQRLWNDPDDRIAPKTLKILNDLAQKHAVKMSAFRPQKETIAGALSILPFFVSIDGPFPAVAEFLRDFEENQQTLIVNNVQFASSDQNTHAVTAALEVSAYIDPNRDVGSATVVVQTSPKSSSKSIKTPSRKRNTPSNRAVPRGVTKA